MSIRKIKILLVDDDSDYCRLVKMAMQKATGSVRFAVATAGNLATGLECLKSNSFDLVLLDLGLPDSYGLETFDRTHRLYPQVPIVMLTGLEDELISVEAIKKGASDYLVKGATSFTDILVRTILYALERKQAEEAIQISERNFRNVINRSADAIAVIDKGGIVLFINPAVQTLFGRNAEELLGKAFGFPIAVGDTTELEIIRKCRTKAIAEMRIVETNWQGKDAYIASLRDITKRKATERKLKKYRENLKVLVKERTEEVDAEKELLSVTFSSMGDGVIVVDPEKRIILFNTVAETLAGWEFERVQDRPIDELFHVVNEHTREAVESPIDKVLRSGKTEAGTDLDILLAMDGTERPISTIAAPIRKNDGTIIGIVMVFRDVSREREIDRLKDDFISSVSHELRTPLTSIKAYTETILHDFDMPEQTKLQFLGIIDEESNRLANLIEGLLEVSRLESGTVKISRDPVDITAVIGRVTSVLRPLADKKNIQLNVNVCGLPGQLLGDESRILSAVTNLVNNAIKFTPEGGQVCVWAQQQAGELVIRVSDTGMGIPKEALPKIFDRFYRVHHPGKQIQGTGLGLAIVKKIVALHGGRIEIESEVNQGTTFTVFLPLAANPIPDACPAK
ncbi:MAG: PAS domain S-box protein [Planctomycetota bacterium]|nr:PAS domain S-box protein [Planctomycetota bacterium]